VTKSHEEQWTRLAPPAQKTLPGELQPSTPANLDRYQPHFGPINGAHLPSRIESSVSNPESSHELIDLPQPSPSDFANAPSTDDFSANIPLTPELVEEEALRGDFAIRWVVILLAGLMACTQIADSRTLTHVKSGQYLASHGLLPPVTDVFSYTASEQRWTNLSWLFDLALAGLYATAAWQGLTVLKIVVVGVSFWFLAQIYRPNTPTWWNSICASVALLAIHQRFTAETTLVTILGITLTLTWLHQFSSGTLWKQGWWLVPTYLFWANLDPRMFLGVALLLLYGAGDAVSRLLGITAPTTGTTSTEVSTSRPVAARKRFWMTVAACIVVTLVNPFGWQSLLSPLSVYQAEYPAWQAYFPRNPTVEALLAFPATSPNFWNWNIATVSLMTLTAGAAILFVLNWSRMDVGYLFVMFGFAAFGVAAIHEHAVVALVFCVLAALNGQQWYAATFRQTYSVARGELLFSRGGRAVTVVALSALALLAGSGGLRGPDGSRTGWGLDPSLQSTLDGLQKQLADSLDDRPFHFRPGQGDQLIWVGQRSFIDSRLALFHERNGRNIIDTHLQLREALVKGETKNWTPDFDRYGITHVLPRLTAPRPDYTTFFGLLQSGAWQLTDLAAATAVLYRRDIDTPELAKFLASHQIDFIKQAYTAETKPVLPRDKWVSRPSVYQKHLRVPPAPVPAEIQEAQHLLTLAIAQGQTPLQTEPRAILYVAIRKAQAGLLKNPDSAEGYRVLGRAYLLLANWDAIYLLNDSRLRYSGLRYFQALLALNQSLVADPNDYETHRVLAVTYQEAGRIDLAKRELSACDGLLSRMPTLDDDQIAEQLQIIRIIEQIDKQLQQIETELDQAVAAGGNTLQVAGLALERGCPLRALRHLDENSDALLGNVPAQQLRVTLLLEAGRAQEAFDAAALLEQAPNRQPNSEWESIAAMTHLANGDYDSATRRLRQARIELEQAAFSRLLEGMAPQTTTDQPQAAWPITALASGTQSWPRAADQAVQFAITTGMIEVEQGQVAKAAKTLHSALDSDPNTAARQMAAYYVYVLTGEEIDLLPPAETIPILFEGEPSP